MENKTIEKKAIICGIQQIGIGVSDVNQAWAWYREFFGVDISIFNEKAVADIMLPYTGGLPRERHAVLAMNLQGGGGFEIWQHTSFTPRGPEFDIKPGDYGIYACKIKCRNIEQTHSLYKEKKGDISPIYKNVSGEDFFYIRDPFGNLFQMVEVDQDWFSLEKNKVSGGVFGTIMGCQDMEATIQFYSSVLGYDVVIADKTSSFEDFDWLCQEGDHIRDQSLGLKEDTAAPQYRRVLLGHSQKRQGPFAALLGDSQIELVQVINPKNPSRKIFENRMWGELGFIQLCFDVKNLRKLKQDCEALNYPFTVDSATKQEGFGMEAAQGNFAYNEDPSGSLIEYVETLKIPIAKKIGLYLNLKNFKDDKNLPRFLVKSLSFMRVKL